jgi:hypothetical protein
MCITSGARREMPVATDVYLHLCTTVPYRDPRIRVKRTYTVLYTSRDAHACEAIKPAQYTVEFTDSDTARGSRTVRTVRY